MTNAKTVIVASVFLFGANTWAMAGTGTAEFWASTNTLGVLTRGSGVTSSSQLATGSYVMEFPRDINKCSWTGTILGKSAGLISLSTVSGQPNQLSILTFTTSGAPVNRATGILVKCQD
jgi:hypothetical protein